MEITAFRTGDEAVSQAISVILLVAIVVVLTAVVGPVVLGVGTQVAEGEPAPSARMSWSYDQGTATLTMTHSGGETIREGSLKFVGSESGQVSPTWSGADDRVTANDEATLSGIQPDEIVRVFWIDPDDDTQDKQQLVVMWIGPDADPPDG